MTPNPPTAPRARDRPRAATAWCCALLVGSALLTGCDSSGGAPRDPKPPSSGTPVPHGYVEGAEETSDQQSRLVLADADSGAVGVLDLIEGKVTPLTRAEGVQRLRTDGRFGYLGTAGATRVLDSGAWTVDHGDHVHYYRTAIRDVGTVDAAVPDRVHGDPALTALSSGTGTLLLDREELESGTAGPGRALTGTGRGAVVPYREHLLVASTGAEHATVQVLDRDGAEVAALAEPCARAAGEAVTRRGVVFGCADGALLVTEEKGTFSAAKIPYGTPVATAERARELRHRAGSTTLAATSGGDAVWILDVTERAWTRVETGPVVAATTAGEGAPLLALGKDGVLSAYDTATGERTARTRLLSAKGAASAVIEIDTSRAYVNDAAARKVYEIDYNDRLRQARTFPLGFAPTHMVETGR
ncbi:hypothetical protein [Streptomyces corynorhini]|uniref:ABC transporter n=1 Tax=Streptomyces corynorhini TaxID=2282652 RepID=A0A370BD65_9ACTN|nr:hypothetical protein [Streptomyces corynorhini]RDG37395.1 hypothetical protein DVH02_14630 [Streptomyces corynorhini]